MTQLAPSLILHSNGYGPAVDKLERIAPTMGFDLNSGDGKPFTTARTSLHALGARLGLEAQAQAHCTGWMVKWLPRVSGYVRGRNVRCY